MKALSVPCPVCRRDVPWTEASRWRPFCCARCKSIDLGDWASGRHAIAGDAVDDAAGESSPLSAGRSG